MSLRLNMFQNIPFRIFWRGKWLMLWWLYFWWCCRGQLYFRLAFWWEDWLFNWFESISLHFKSFVFWWHRTCIWLQCIPRSTWRCTRHFWFCLVFPNNWCDKWFLLRWRLLILWSFIRSVLSIVFCRKIGWWLDREISTIEEGGLAYCLIAEDDYFEFEVVIVALHAYVIFI